jgi:hypothetical protein
MKFAGLLVMPAGFFLTVAALVLFPDAALRATFVVCGLAVEVLGLGVAVRGHMERRQEPQIAAEPRVTGAASRR